MIKKLLHFSSLIGRIALRRPSDLRHVLGVATWGAEQVVNPEADIRPLGKITISALADSSLLLKVQIFPHVPASVSPLECAALAALIRKTNARKIFEFGTYKGVSTTQLALNIGNDGQVYTLDLPEDHPAYSLDILKEAERQIAAEGGKGILLPAELRNRVTFLRSDSATFDTRPYLNSMDLIFVDGAHSYDYVKNDTEKGWEMLRPGGIIAWHDCNPNHPDVVRFLQSFKVHVTVVEGTTLAFAFK